MHQDDLDFRGVSSPDYDSALCEQQTILLNQIELLALDAAIHSPPKRGEIYTLKQQYNLLVKKRAELAITPLSDPMEVLPPDLWPDIIRNIIDGLQYPVNKLLDLISVSKGWCSLLTTLPVIWTHIRLDQCEPDYLAKAMMCIQLSGECKIDLNIGHLTTDEWREISSTIVPEGRRIWRLSFVIRDTDFMVIRQVLVDFTNLPVLQELSLPNMPSQFSDQQYIYALLMKKMPSIKTVTTRRVAMQDQIWNPYLTRCYLQRESLNADAIETLVLLSHLRHLVFVETTQILEDTPSLLKLSFGSVTTFRYCGADICRRLTWIGNNLSTLSTHYYPENGDANALLVALSRFPHLHELTIAIFSSSWVQPMQNKGHIASPHNSVRVLRLDAFAQDQYDADWDVFFSIFFPASPYLEVLSVQSGLITDMGWSSIRSITNLRDLYIGVYSIDDSSSIPLNMESLRHFQWTVGSHSLAQLLPRLQSKFLQTLRLVEIKSYPPVTATTLYMVEGAAFPNITSLVISNESAATTWDLRALSKLRELEVQAPTERNHMMYWVSDILEAILIRPRDNPALEKITFTCDFVEWDILLLMLERRNFLNEIRISPIKTFVFNRDLPYRLLYPLSELLGGRFVERDSNYSFSLEAIGERMWNESLSGCMRCHYSFRECESFLIPRCETHPDEAMGTGDDKEYHRANEYLVADPRLPLETTRWLSGRRERLTSFMRRYEEPGIQFHRSLWCDVSTPRQGGGAITGDVLVGAHFVRDLEEYDVGVNA